MNTETAAKQFSEDFLDQAYTDVISICRAVGTPKSRKIAVEFGKLIVELQHMKESIE